MREAKSVPHAHTEEGSLRETPLQQQADLPLAGRKSAQPESHLAVRVGETAGLRGVDSLHHRPFAGGGLLTIDAVLFDGEPTQRPVRNVSGFPGRAPWANNAHLQGSRFNLGSAVPNHGAGNNFQCAPQICVPSKLISPGKVRQGNSGPEIKLDSHTSYKIYELRSRV